MREGMVAQAVSGIVALALGSWTHAAYITDWSAGDTYYLADSTDDSSGGAFTEITGIYFRQSGSTAYFRMDLLSAPSTEGAGPDYAIFLDTQPGGAAWGNGSADPSLSYFVAQGLSGIDMIPADGHYWFFGWQASHYHIYDGTTSPYNFSIDSLGSIGGAFQSAENGGRTLEWSIPFSAIGSSTFTMWGGTMNIANNGQTWDLTGPIVTSSEGTEIPEPSTLVLLSLVSLLGASFRRRLILH